MNPADSLIVDPARADVIRVARAELDRARASIKRGTQDRSLSQVRFTASTLTEVVLMAALPCAALVWVKPWLMKLWYTTILWWSAMLDLPLRMGRDRGVDELQWLAASSASLVPGPITGVATAALVIGGFASTFWMRDHQVPLKYVVRTLCVVQASALLFFLFVPSRFPYTIQGHVSAMLNAGYALMLALPVLLALGWGVLRLPFQHKLFYPSLILAYYTVMLPHKALLHALILQHFSLLFMPILYLCFGAVFDLMVFVALYSWLASHVPEGALSPEFAR